ncbi:MAG: DUF4287 domain-containing protein [Chitinophagales bacterium]|nr:DUF4287 domain-containing protein [Chitinophagales bacterium]
MAKTSGEFEQEFIQTAKEKTGNTVEEWFPLLKASGFSKQMELLNWLKKEKGFNHMQASLLAGIYLNNGKPVYNSEENLLENQFVKCEGVRALFEYVSEQILKHFPDTRMLPKKTYVSFTAKREFAAINIKPKEIRLGLDLGGKPFNEVVQKAKLTGPMPRISHMVVISDTSQFDKQLLDLIRQSYEKVNA